MSFSTQTRAVIRVAGPTTYRVFASDLGEGRLEVRLAADDLLVHVRAEMTAQRVRDTLFSTRPLVSVLPYLLAAHGGPVEPAAPALGIAGLVVHLPPATRCVANRMAAAPGRPRPAHIRLEVGPLT